MYTGVRKSAKPPEVITLDSDTVSEGNSILDVSSGTLVELDLDLLNEDTIIPSENDENDENEEPFQVTIF